MISLRNITIAYLAIMLLLIVFDLDKHLAALLFQLEGNQWALRHAWWTQKVLHDGAHDVSVALYVLVILMYGMSFWYEKLKTYRFGLSYLSLSIPVATLSVSLLKRLTHVDCPWSVVDFDGSRPYQLWLESLISPVAGAGNCFPAGHASSAYMFFALYFVCRHYWPKHAIKVLGLVIVSGLVFGAAQQLRGAHFISHDLTSAFICWSLTYLIWQYHSRRFVTQHEQALQ